MVTAVIQRTDRRERSDAEFVAEVERDRVRADDEKNREIFANVQNLASFVAQQQKSA